MTIILKKKRLKMGRHKKMENTFNAQKKIVVDNPQVKPTLFEKENGDISSIISRKTAFSDTKEQDRIINDVEILGYTHYETMNLGGNEILLRFRKNSTSR
jgi:hypothetical protein